MISALKELHNKITGYHKDESVSYEKKNFYLVMTCSVPILLLVALVFFFGKTDSIMSLYLAFVALFVAVITALASMFSEQVRFSYFYSIFFNFGFIPVVFFMSEGIFFGMVLFFVLGIIVTMVLLGRQKYVIPIVALEFIYDITLVFYTYFYKGKVYIGRTRMPQEIAIAFSFACVEAAIVFLFIYQNYIHREIRKKIESDNISIKKAENTRGRFLANMTHEIRTPMNAIIGMTDLILREDLSRSAREHVDTIKNASSQLLSIINNILEYSKLDSGRAELVNNEYSFRSMIETVINDIAPKYERDDISLNIHIKKDIPDRLFGDEVRIKQVLKYLLFSPLIKNNNGMVNVDIDYDYDTDNRVVTMLVKIASTGRGLTAEEITAIYNAYSNYDSRQKTNYNRTGLEISVCKMILGMMKGDLTIDSIENIGMSLEFNFCNYVVDDKPIVEVVLDKPVHILNYITEKVYELSANRLIGELGFSSAYVRTPVSFRSILEKQQFTHIFIPDYCYEDLKEYIEAFNIESNVYVITDSRHCIGDYGKCRIIRKPVQIFNVLEILDGSYNEEKYKNTEGVQVIKYPYARVLCVDDSAVNLKVLSNLLHEYDINPVTCKSGKEALADLENNEYDLMLIDQKMPEMDGSELVANIRKLPGNNASAPIVCATADFGPNIKEELIIAGFNDYLAKPINIKFLSHILEDYLPEELKVVRTVKPIDKKKKIEKAPEKEPEIDPTEFTPEIGIANLGGSKDAYISVLSAYYEEGIKQITEVPKMFESGDISLYTTNVHALKSSSATIGALGISPLFKALEFAGKDNDTEYIASNSAKAFEYLVIVLEKVKDYLEAEGALTEEPEQVFDDSEVLSLDPEIINELSSCVLSMNLRRCEEILGELSSKNYGSEINEKIKKMKHCYENFEYMEIKSIIGEIS